MFLATRDRARRLLSLPHTPLHRSVGIPCFLSACVIMVFFSSIASAQVGAVTQSPDCATIGANYDGWTVTTDQHQIPRVTPLLPVGTPTDGGASVSGVPIIYTPTDTAGNVWGH